MTELTLLFQLFQRQVEAHQRQVETQHDAQQRQMEGQQRQMVAQQKQMEDLINRLAPSPGSSAPYTSAASIPPFRSHFRIVKYYSTPSLLPTLFPTTKWHVLTNQTTATCKLLSTLAGQQTLPKVINELTLTTFMKTLYDPRRFCCHRSYTRKPGETIPVLAARIRQEASTCDFPSVKDVQDEATRTQFICTVKSEAILKTLFKVKDDDLTFQRAVELAQEIEDVPR